MLSVSLFSFFTIYYVFNQITFEKKNLLTSDMYTTNRLYRLFLSSGPLGRHPFIAAKVFDESLALPRTHMKFAEFLINKNFKI